MDSGKIALWIQESNKIEGYDIPVQEYLNYFETGKTEYLNEKDSLIVSGSCKAYNRALQWATTAKRMTKVRMNMLHKDLMTGLLPNWDSKYVGGFRDLDVVVSIGGRRKHGVVEGTEELKELIKRLNKYLDVNIDDILETHYEFEILHPYIDGNGRMGRLLTWWQILSRFRFDMKEMHDTFLDIFRGDIMHLDVDKELEKEDFEFEPMRQHYYQSIRDYDWKKNKLYYMLELSKLDEKFDL